MWLSVAGGLQLRALHLDLWCWSLGDAWDAYRGRWLGFEHSGSPVRLWLSLLAVLRDTSPIQVARLVFQGRHAPWQGELLLPGSRNSGACLLLFPAPDLPCSAFIFCVGRAALHCQA